LYLCADLDDAERLAPVLGGLVDDLFQQAYARVGKRNAALDPGLLVVIDEAGNWPMRNLPGRSGARRMGADRDRRLAEAHDLLVPAVGKLASTQDWLTVLDVSRRLPNYSTNNCLLLMVQGAEGLVMGYQAWRRIPARDGGHCQVRRGAKGLAILAPVTRTVVGGGAGEPDEVAHRGHPGTVTASTAGSMAAGHCGLGRAGARHQALLDHL